MLHIRMENHLPVEVSTTYPKGMAPTDWYRKADGTMGPDGWLDRNDMKSFAFARTLADLLTEKLGRTFLPCDKGDGVYPRYDVIEAPKVGDKVSRGFNGDYYPEGEIVKVTPTYQITTSTGKKFRRYKETAGWREVGRGFWMTAGHIDERNPHF